MNTRNHRANCDGCVCTHTCAGGGVCNLLMLITPLEIDILHDLFIVRCRKRKNSLIFKTVLLKWPEETENYFYLSCILLITS